MKLLTLTPELRAYVVAAIVVYAAACVPAAALLQTFWRPARPPPFLPVYAATMVVVAAVAVAALRLPSLTQTSLAALVPSIVVGLVGGEVAVRADAALRRVLRRRARGRLAADDRALLERRPLTPPPASAAAGSTAAFPGGGAGALALLLAIAALEELLFRGVLVDLSLGLSTAPAALCVAATLAAFAAAHVYGGWVEVVAKLPLGLATLLAALPFRAVAGAVAAHALFNTRAWLAARAAAGGARE